MRTGYLKFCIDIFLKRPVRGGMICSGFNAAEHLDLDLGAMGAWKKEERCLRCGVNCEIISNV